MDEMNLNDLFEYIDEMFAHEIPVDAGNIEWDDEAFSKALGSILEE